MILPCSHNYCSVCIRRSLGFKQQCPTCQRSATLGDLRNNRTLDFLAQQFSDFRQTLIQTIQQQMEEWKKQSAEIVYLPPSTASSSSSSSSSSVVPNASNTLNILPPLPSPHEPTRSKPMNTFFKKTTPKQRTSTNVIKVECPVCLTSIVQVQMNQHLDECLGKQQNADKMPTITDVPIHSRQPQPVYNLLSDTQLRRILKECSLPTSGDRDLLIRRHREYTIQHNAQQDSLFTKSDTLVIKEVLKKEQQKSNAHANKSNHQFGLFDSFSSTQKPQTTIVSNGKTNGINKKRKNGEITSILPSSTNSFFSSSSSNNTSSTLSSSSSNLEHSAIDLSVDDSPSPQPSSSSSIPLVVSSTSSSTPASFVSPSPPVDASSPHSSSSSASSFSSSSISTIPRIGDGFDALIRQLHEQKRQRLMAKRKAMEEEEETKEKEITKTTEGGEKRGVEQTEETTDKVKEMDDTLALHPSIEKAVDASTASSVSIPVQCSASSPSSSHLSSAPIPSSSTSLSPTVSTLHSTSSSTSPSASSASVSASSSSSSSSPSSSWPYPYRAIYIESSRQIFYWNTVTKIGTFQAPSRKEEEEKNETKQYKLYTPVVEEKKTIITSVEEETKQEETQQGETQVTDVETQHQTNDMKEYVKPSDNNKPDNGETSEVIS